MGRQLRTNVPLVLDKLKLSVPDLKELKRRETASRYQQKRNFDKHHRVRSYRFLNPGDRVWVSDLKVSGSVIRSVSPRSFLVVTQYGQLRCHLSLLVPNNQGEENRCESPKLYAPEQSQAADTCLPSTNTQLSLSSGSYVTRSGRISKEPVRFED